MNITIEQVDKLLDYANVTYEEARDALIATDGKILDAIVYLERQGKVPLRGISGGAITVLPGNAQEQRDYKQPKGEEFSETMRRFFNWLGGLFERNSTFVATYKDADIISMPSIIMIIIAFFAFYVVLPVMLVGLIFGVRYRFDDKEYYLKHDKIDDDSEKL